MDIDAIFLGNLGVKSQNANNYLSRLEEAMRKIEVTTPLRIAHFLAQMLHESGLLAFTEENLNYSKTALRKTFGKYFTESEAAAFARQPEKIANRVYANRIGNGPESSGDGWRYRGRGFIQLTGRANYRDFSDWLGEDVENNPDRVANEYVAHSAAFFWSTRKLNTLADRDDIIDITKKINGGLNGFEHRVALLEKIKDSMDAPAPAGDVSRPAEPDDQPLGVLLSEKPELRVNQDLINFFYRRSDGTYAGASRLASRYGLRLDSLTGDRNAPVERLL